VLRLHRVEGDLPDGIAELRVEATAEGIGNVGRLMDDWLSGVERFTKPGETLLAAYDYETFVGIGGVTVEPDPTHRAMRMRRLYVRTGLARSRHRSRVGRSADDTGAIGVGSPDVERRPSGIGRVLGSTGICARETSNTNA